jgi:uncharacterized membrane-anchored protein YhcB (DUF1043 family)
MILSILGAAMSLLNRKSKQIKALEADLEQTRKRADQLERDLKYKQNQLDDYREQVTRHFSRSAELFSPQSNAYPAIYQHMAKGAQELCGKAVLKLLEQVADRRFLPQAQNDSRELNVEIVTENDAGRRHSDRDRLLEPLPPARVAS